MNNTVRPTPAVDSPSNETSNACRKKAFGLAMVGDIFTYKAAATLTGPIVRKNWIASPDGTLFDLMITVRKGWMLGLPTGYVYTLAEMAEYIQVGDDYYVRLEDGSKVKHIVTEKRWEQTPQGYMPSFSHAVKPSLETLEYVEFLDA